MHPLSRYGRLGGAADKKVRLTLGAQSRLGTPLRRLRPGAQTVGLVTEGPADAHRRLRTGTTLAAPPRISAAPNRRLARLVVTTVPQRALAGQLDPRRRSSSARGGLGMKPLVFTCIIAALCCAIGSLEGQQRKSKTAQCMDVCRFKFVRCESKELLASLPQPKRLARQVGRPSAAAAGEPAADARASQQQLLPCHRTRRRCESGCKRKPRSASLH